MTLFTDYAGRTVRLTDERRRHLLSHPEMLALEPLLERDRVAPDGGAIADGRHRPALLPERRYLTVWIEAALRRREAVADGFFRDNGLCNG